MSERTIDSFLAAPPRCRAKPKAVAIAAAMPRETKRRTRSGCMLRGYPLPVVGQVYAERSEASPVAHPGNHPRAPRADSPVGEIMAIAPEILRCAQDELATITQVTQI